jgi:hypothetical protein
MNTTLLNRTDDIRGGLRGVGHRPETWPIAVLVAAPLFVAVLALVFFVRILRSAPHGMQSKDNSGCKALSFMEQGMLVAIVDPRPVLEEVLMAPEQAAGKPVRRSRSSAVSPV